MPRRRHARLLGSHRPRLGHFLSGEMLEERLVLSAEQALLLDTFDDGNLGSNSTGIGEGWTTATFGGGGGEVDSAFRFDGRPLGNWHLYEISSRDTLPVWQAEATRFEFRTGRLEISAGNSLGDLKQQFGIVSAYEPRSGSGLGPDHNEANLFQNTAGGLFVELYYDQISDDGDVVVSGAVRAANQSKAPWREGDIDVGVFSPVRFTFDAYDGQAELVTTISVSQSGWSVGFSEDLTIQTAEGEVQVEGNAFHGDWSWRSLGDAAISTEFMDGGFAFAMAQNLDIGRGSVDLIEVLACPDAEFVQDEYEPNNAFDQAIELPSGDGMIEGLSIHSSLDEDWFRWTAATDGMLSANLYHDATEGDLDLTLLSAEGLPLDVAATLYNHEHVRWQVQTGETYLLQVKGFQEQSNPTYDIGLLTSPLAEERIYVAVGNEVQVFDFHGTRVQTITAPVLETGPIGDVEIGPDEAIYVSVDVGDNAGEDGKIVQFSPSGALLATLPVPQDTYARQARYPFGFDVLEDGTFLIAQPNAGRIVRADRHAKVLDTYLVGNATPSDATVTSSGEVVFADDSAGESMLNSIPGSRTWIADRGNDRVVLRDAAGNSLQTHSGVRPIDAEQNTRGTLYISELTSVQPFTQGTLRALDAAGDELFAAPIPGLPLGLATSAGFKPAGVPTGLLDSDADGLPDVWETSGLDVNGDSVIDLNLSAMGADPRHKDLFVEIDAMAGRVPDPRAIDDVRAAFARVPNGLINNPDGRDGVTLHTIIDETNIPLSDFTPSGSGLTDAAIQANAWRRFDAIKQTRFGTASQRADPNWSNIRNALGQVFHYSLFADNYDPSTSGGLAELPGNDFMVTLGRWSPVGGTRDEQAGMFMHELGHNLNLRHGGSDDIHRKPNYHSVMNYLWTVPTDLTQGWTLDYSREQIATLDEGNLNESEGIGFARNSEHDTDGHRVSIGPAPTILVPEVGPVDFSGGDADGDGDALNDTGIQLDLNVGFEDVNRDGRIDAADAALDRSPGQLLIGHNDWSNLRLSRTGSHNFNDGVHQNAPLDERPPATSSQPRLATIRDDFDDGNLETNEHGIGTGWTSATFGGGAVEADSAFRFDGRFLGEWNLWEISSRESFDVLGDATTVQFVSGNVEVARDNAQRMGPEWVGLAGDYDFRHQFGVVSEHEPRSGSGGFPDHNEAYLYQNSAGGLYVELAYERVFGPRDLRVVGQIRAVNQNKPTGTLDESVEGLFTPVTFEFPNYDGQMDLVTSFTLNAAGWSVHFNSEISATALAAGIEVAGSTISGDWTAESLGDAAPTNEFHDGAYALAMMQNVARGGGHADVGLVQVVERPRSDAGGDAMEPNDTWETASSLPDSGGVFASLTIQPAGDEDWFRWSANHAGTVTFHAQHNAEAGAPLTLTLYDAALEIIVSSIEGIASTFVQPGEAYYARIAADEMSAREYDLVVDPFAALAIDAGLVAVDASLPGINGGPDRRISAVSRPGGEIEQFVSDELIVTATSEEELESFVNAVGGSVSTLPLPIPRPEWNVDLRAEIPESDSYLVRVDLNQAQPGVFKTVAETLELPLDATFSSLDALKLFSIAAEATVNLGLTVAPNFVTQLYSPDVVLWKTDEHTSGNSTVNGFDLREIRHPDLQVARAWQFLDLLDLGRRGQHGSGRVDVAIVDLGFALNEDFPPKAVIPMYDFVDGDTDATGSPYLAEDNKEWHGTQSLSTVAARHNNAFGAAGIGGQVADPMIFHVANSVWDMADAIRTATRWGADVINVSMGAECGFLCGMFAVFSGAGSLASAVRAANSSGVTVVAAAGNQGWNLDQKLLIPAELPGVIGVGALDASNVNARNDSSYGSNIDIWAPGVGLTATPIPTTAPNNSTFGATSGASPYIAGIVAMMNAIDPTLRSADVVSILQQTANISTDPKVANGYVNAYAAVVETARRAGVRPVGDFLEPDDPPQAPIPYVGNEITRTIAPGDWDVYELTLDDYSTLHIEADYFDEITPGNELDLDFNTLTSGTDIGGNTRLELDLMRPGVHSIVVRGRDPNSINAYTIRTAIAAATIDPDVFDDGKPAGPEQRNDTRERAVVMPGVVSPSLTLHTMQIHDLNFHVPTDSDYFTVKLPPATDSDTGEPECLAANDPLLQDPGTKQGVFSLSISPDAKRAFEIELYDSSGQAITAGQTSPWEYELQCPHNVFPDGEVTFGVRDPAGRNFYNLDLQYHRADTLITPGWFLEFEQPPFRQFIPAFIDRITRVFPRDPRVVNDVLGGVSEELPAEYLQLRLTEQTNYVADIRTPTDQPMVLTLVDELGNTLGVAIPLLLPVGAPPPEAASYTTQRLTVDDLPAGEYFLKLEGSVFGTTYELSISQPEPLPGDIDEDGTVSFADFLILSTNFGETQGQTRDEGDLDGDGAVQFSDFLILSANFGRTALPAAPPVPSDTLARDVLFASNGW